MPKTRILNRRRLLKGMAAGVGCTILPRHVLGGRGNVSPNEKITLGCIGMGGQGNVNLARFLQMKELQVVAVCDVNKEGGGYLSWEWTQGKGRKTCGREPARRLVNERYADEKGLGHYKGCNAYADFRDLFENEDVDAVMVATPDFSHAMIVMEALKRGKHVYCEKPLAYSLHEVREITKAARRAKVATQLGNQGQAKEADRLIQEYLLDGAVGGVREVHVNLGRRFWDPPRARPAETPPVPDGLDWDLWLGPAPERPYHPDYHPWRWRDWRDFGTGQLGDMGCHTLSAVFKALKLEHPVSAEGVCEEAPDPEIYPRKFKVSFEFPARGDLPPVTLHWHDEGYDPPRPGELEPERRLGSPLFIGDEGTLMGYRLIPQSRMKEYGRPPKVLPRSPGHYQEWVDAILGGPPAGSDFVRHSGQLTETPLLGNIALRLGKKLQFDGPNLEITNDDAANRLLHREYREGWTL